ncbi:uncharacterized protein HD556DRAFT_1441885 [Suillus plorans]|uniref:Uncharacterized protein n=1 Tax=Suillus plorans TaxID=116603 RepID=A0A9P7AT28_9AGAM|nr:uncharacterized protein HD556DRAFT_1441885 [Suillus plorans]KAG1796050.1 hypothetical protein HD556DRAFT_1441885 [Suillus plorans]
MSNSKPVHLNISINPLCPSGAISDLYEVVDAIGSMTIYDIDDLEANLIMDLTRAKRDVFNAEKKLADCLLREHEVMASLSNSDVHGPASGRGPAKAEPD